jgi:hypothetical protein
VTAPVGVWLIAGTAISVPYPCRCRVGRECSLVFCPCAGRMDVWNFAPGCCAWVVTPAVAAAAQAEYSARRASYATR